jgi:outer membrane protein assembly factor BamC
MPAAAHSETFPVTRVPALSLLRGSALALAVALAGCSSLEKFVAGDKIDYRSQGASTPTLEVPPDLTQLARDTRYQQSGGAVSAAAFQAGASAPAAARSSVEVAPSQIGDVRVERAGTQRWLVTSQTPEQIWPRLQTFWKDSGFTLVVDDAASGVLETEWNENRAKLPQDIIRRSIGKVFDPIYSTGERDKFRTRVERAGGDTEIYVSHRGMEEVYTTALKDTTIWQPRPADPDLEAELLARLMTRLGVKEDAARSAVAGTPAAPARARLLSGGAGAALQVDDGFDRAWRRVGLALDRSGFTVEDRDRAQGLYFVRYVDPAKAGKGEPGFFAKLFSFGAKGDAGGPARYRVSVKGDGDHSTVAVLTAQGTPENGDAGKRIVGLLVDELK